MHFKQFKFATSFTKFNSKIRLLFFNRDLKIIYQDLGAFYINSLVYINIQVAHTRRGFDLFECFMTTLTK